MNYGYILGCATASHVFKSFDESSNQSENSVNSERIEIIPC